MCSSKMTTISVIIRTLNEEKYLDELLTAISNQYVSNMNVEVVIVDSGSTDNTLKIAQKHKANITTIQKNEFSFGRSLNIGCAYSKGDFLVFISGHCIPCSNSWLADLVEPLLKDCSYTYGRQIGRDTTRFSENMLFKKYYPDVSQVPQKGFFCNNANSAIRRSSWCEFRFDEDLPGCEDMALAKQLSLKNQKIGYVAEACVFHIHDETWQQVKNRYEREAIALQEIMPEVQLSFIDVTKFFSAAILNDFIAAFSEKILLKELFNIFRFRFAQYKGSYNGNKNIRMLSQEMKHKYFYPNDNEI